MAPTGSTTPVEPPTPSHCSAPSPMPRTCLLGFALDVDPQNRPTWMTGPRCRTAPRCLAWLTAMCATAEAGGRGGGDGFGRSAMAGVAYGDVCHRGNDRAGRRADESRRTGRTH